MALRTGIVCCLWAASLTLAATEWEPWPSPVYEIQVRPSVVVQTFPSIDTSAGCLKLHSFNQLYRLSVSTTGREFFAYELEGGIAHTTLRKCELDDLRLTGRCFLLNDVSALDPLSLSVGLTVAGVNGVALRDFNLMHHGHMEYEAHLSAGREQTVFDTWCWRWWQAVGIGAGDIGKPWIRSKTIVERRYAKCHCFHAIAEIRLGLGNEPLDLSQPFDGYGPIRYRLVDIGGGYSYHNQDVTLTTQYQYRVYGRYVPIQAHTLSLNVFYVF